MKRYVMNAAVLPGFGDYSYRTITRVDARNWMLEGPYESAVGYPETAEAIAFALDVPAPAVNRIRIEMETGDEALVYRLQQRLPSETKGTLDWRQVAESAELGWLRRTA